jgi:hypothetical protein
MKRTHHYSAPRVAIDDDDDFQPVVAPRNTYLPARPYTDISMTEQTILSTAITGSAQVMAQRQMAHLSRSDETPLTNALASLIYSLAYSAAGWLITGGILFIAYNLVGGDKAIYVIAWLILWGICFLGALYMNRRQGFWFSPAGLDHAEIQSRERIAFHVIDKHIELIKARWEKEG